MHIRSQEIDTMYTKARILSKLLQANIELEPAEFYMRITTCQNLSLLGQGIMELERKSILNTQCLLVLLSMLEKLKAPTNQHVLDLVDTLPKLVATIYFSDVMFDLAFGMTEVLKLPVHIAISYAVPLYRRGIVDAEDMAIIYSKKNPYALLHALKHLYCDNILNNDLVNTVLNILTGEQISHLLKLLRQGSRARDAVRGLFAIEPTELDDGKLMIPPPLITITKLMNYDLPIQYHGPEIQAETPQRVIPPAHSPAAAAASSLPAPRVIQPQPSHLHGARPSASASSQRSTRQLSKPVTDALNALADAGLMKANLLPAFLGALERSPDPQKFAANAITVNNRGALSKDLINYGFKDGIAEDCLYLLQARIVTPQALFIYHHINIPSEKRRIIVPTLKFLISKQALTEGNQIHLIKSVQLLEAFKTLVANNLADEFFNVIHRLQFPKAAANALVKLPEQILSPKIVEHLNGYFKLAKLKAIIDELLSLHSQGLDQNEIESKIVEFTNTYVPPPRRKPMMQNAAASAVQEDEELDEDEVEIDEDSAAKRQKPEPVQAAAAAAAALPSLGVFSPRSSAGFSSMQSAHEDRSSVVSVAQAPAASSNGNAMEIDLDSLFRAPGPKA